MDGLTVLFFMCGLRQVIEDIAPTERMERVRMIQCIRVMQELLHK